MPQSASSDPLSFAAFDLSAGDREALLKIARETITAKLEGREPVYPAVTPALRRRAGAFVTLHEAVPGKVDPADHCLRGCIGYIGEQFQLADTVKRAAIGSAFHDRRFSPVTLAELTRVRIEISVLGPFHRVEDCGQIQPGVHGVMIRKGFRTGLLLPQVASEYGWDRSELLQHLCRKAGLPPNAFREPDAELEAFTAVVFDEQESATAGPI
ncbi:AmmeMemoRadiSam system protein A [Salinispira pacifica]